MVNGTYAAFSPPRNCISSFIFHDTRRRPFLFFSHCCLFHSCSALKKSSSINEATSPAICIVYTCKFIFLHVFCAVGVCFCPCFVSPLIEIGKMIYGGRKQRIKAARPSGTPTNGHELIFIRSVSNEAGKGNISAKTDQSPPVSVCSRDL